MDDSTLAIHTAMLRSIFNPSRTKVFIKPLIPPFTHTPISHQRQSSCNVRHPMVHLEPFGVEGLAQEHDTWTGSVGDQTALRLMDDSLTHPPEPEELLQNGKQCTTTAMCIPSSACGLGLRAAGPQYAWRAASSREQYESSQGQKYSHRNTFWQIKPFYI